MFVVRVTGHESVERVPISIFHIYLIHELINVHVLNLRSMEYLRYLSNLGTLVWDGNHSF